MSTSKTWCHDVFILRPSRRGHPRAPLDSIGSRVRHGLPLTCRIILSFLSNAMPHPPTYVSSPTTRIFASPSGSARKKSWSSKRTGHPTQRYFLLAAEKWAPRCRSMSTTRLLYWTKPHRCFGTGHSRTHVPSRVRRGSGVGGRGITPASLTTRPRPFVVPVGGSMGVADVWDDGNAGGTRPRTRGREVLSCGTVF